MWWMLNIIIKKKKKNLGKFHLFLAKHYCSEKPFQKEKTIFEKR